MKKLVVTAEGSRLVDLSPQEISAIEAQWAPAGQEIDRVKSASREGITAARNNELQSLTADWGGEKWDADEATSARIANALFMVKEAAAIGIPVPTSIPWRTADNKDRTLTIAELTQMGAAVFLAQQTVWGKQAALKNAIQSAATVDQVAAIKW